MDRAKPSGARVTAVLDGPVEVGGGTLRVVKLADGTVRVEARGPNGWQTDVDDYFKTCFARPEP